MERREKDFEKIDNIEKIVINLANDVKTHIKVDEMSKQLINEKLGTLSEEIKQQRRHFDDVISRNREHFDDRINNCHAEIHNKLKEEYVTKTELQVAMDEVTLDQNEKRVEGSENAKKDVMTRVRNYAALASGTVILLIVIFNYLAGLIK
jgi:hypothetical protein